METVMWNFLREQIAEQKEDAEQQRQAAKDRRLQKRLQYAGHGENHPGQTGQDRNHRIRREKQEFDRDAEALMALDLLEEELVDSLAQRRHAMLRKIKEIMNE